jgi:hypothetical protein
MRSFKRYSFAIGPLLVLLASIFVTSFSHAESLIPQNDEATLESCPSFGTGFIRLPGGNTCVKTGSVITVTHEANTAKNDLYAETLYLGGNPFIIYDLVPSAALPLKVETEAVISMTTASATEYGPLVSFASIKAVSGYDGDSLILDQAFMAMGGFAIGRRKSFFDFSSGLSFTNGYSSNSVVMLAAYGWDVGSRGRVTVSLEDNNDRRVEDGVWALRGSHVLPDLVVAARVDDNGWGSAQISGAVTLLNDDRVTNCCGVPKDQYGWALSVGLEYRTKIAGHFGRFIFTGAYAEGAVAYLGDTPFATDYIVDVDGKIVRTTGYSLMGSYEHVWRDNLKSTLTVSAISTRSQTRDLLWKPTSILASAGLEYLPVPGLSVGLEGDYYADIGRARYFGLDGEKSQAEFAKLKMYVRRQF